jgi:iron complex outermembrane recepter protein
VNKLNLNNGLRSALLLGVAAVAGLATPAFAQDQSGGVETVVVTGSMLSRSDVETPSPVTILTSQAIQASGLTTTADVVNSLSANNSGSVPTAFGIGFAAGSSGVSLRGMTVNSTLVLINGRRTADFPLADDGHRAFVDLNTIPLDAVDRIEVLKDGASSIYGADAIAGVVNIIMKDEFQGVEGEAEYGDTEQGGGQMERLSARLGYGDMASDHFNAYVDMEYERDDAIRSSKRGFPYNTNDLTSIGGADLNPVGNSIYGAVRPTVLSGDPTDQGAYLNSGFANGDYAASLFQVLNPNGCGSKAKLTTNAVGTYCEQNFAGEYGDIAPQTTRYGMYAHAKERFSNEATFYLDASYFENNVLIDTTPPIISAGTPHNLTNISLPAYLTSGARNPNDPFVQKGACPTMGIEGVTNGLTCPDANVAYTFGDIPGFGVENDHVLQATVGLKGLGTAGHMILALSQPIPGSTPRTTAS